MKSGRTVNTKITTKGQVLGLGAFEKISAVEGVRLTREMKLDLQGLEKRRATSAERTRFITGKYGKKSA